MLGVLMLVVTLCIVVSTGSGGKDPLVIIENMMGVEGETVSL